MGALDYIKGLFNSTTNVVSSTKLHELLSNTPNAAGLDVDQDKMLRLSAVYNAVTTISDTIGSLNTHLYTNKDGNRVKAVDNPLYGLLREKPHTMYNAVDFKAIMQSHVLTWGNAFARIHFNMDNTVKALEVLHPSDVTVVQYGKGIDSEKRYRVTGYGINRELFDNEVIHIMAHSKDGLIGYSPLHIMKENLSGQLAAEQFGSSFFGSGATVGGVLKMKTPIPGKDRKERQEWVKDMRKQFDAMNSGVDNMHKVMFLENDSTFERLTFPPEQIQFIETRKFGVEDVARYFRMPAHMLGIQDGAKYNNVEQSNLWYYKHTILPHITRWEQELNSKLIPEKDKRSIYFKFNVQTLLRGDMKTQVDFMRELVNMQAMTPNEVRDQFEMNPIEGGDQVLIPKNYWHPEELVNE